ncbi:MAG: sensor histidine kinase [Cytophagia bacterium]|nr:sensor histidine kinase [Cytophagia bacterium]
MRSFLKYLACLAVFSQSVVANAQDSTRIAKELELAKTTYSVNIDTSYFHALNVVKWSQKIESKWQEAWGLKMIGVYHQLSQNYDSALNYFSHSKDLFEKEGDSLEIGKSHLSIAQMYLSKGQYDLALANNQMAKNIFEALNNTGFMNSVYDVIGQVYSLMGDHEAALPYFHRSYKMKRDKKDTFNIGIVLSNLTSLHNYLGNEDSVFYYAKLAKPILSKTSNYFFLANTVQVQANTYKDRGEFELAEEKYKEALALYERIDALAGIAETSYNYGFLKDTTGHFSDARVLYEKAMEYAGQTDISQIQMLSSQKLKDVYGQLGDYRKAYQMSLTYDSIRNAFLNAEKQRAITELSVQFETEEKEQKIELQDAQLQAQQNRLQRNQVLVLALVVIVLLLVIVFLLWKNRTEKAYRLERQEAQLKLREAEINAIINSQEKERNRFARDLHDGFGQLISVLKLNLDQLSKVSAKDGDKRMEVFKNGESVINEMYSELRNICFDLMPQTLVKRGLTPALKELGAKLSSTDQLNCEVLIFNNSPRLKELYEISLFRITQEWVNNILKYAEADNITIQLLKDPEELTLTVEDNGNGFDPQTFYEGAGNGWKNIQTRLKLINADFDLDSRPGIKGTMMTVNVPMNKEHFIPTGTEEKLTN